VIATALLPVAVLSLPVLCPMLLPCSLLNAALLRRDLPLVAGLLMSRFGLLWRTCSRPGFRYGSPLLLLLWRSHFLGTLRGSGFLFVLRRSGFFLLWWPDFLRARGGLGLFLVLWLLREPGSTHSEDQKQSGYAHTSSCLHFPKILPPSIQSKDAGTLVQDAGALAGVPSTGW